MAFFCYQSIVYLKNGQSADPINYERVNFETKLFRPGEELRRRSPLFPLNSTRIVLLLLHSPLHCASTAKLKRKKGREGYFHATCIYQSERPSFCRLPAAYCFGLLYCAQAISLSVQFVSASKAVDASSKFGRSAISQSSSGSNYRD